MNPPPAILEPLVDDFAVGTAADRNETIDAGDPTANEGRHTIYLTGLPEHQVDLQLEPEIDYEAGVRVLQDARPLDDEVEVPYRSPFEN